MLSFWCEQEESSSTCCLLLIQKSFFFHGLTENKKEIKSFDIVAHRNEQKKYEDKSVEKS